MSGPRSVPDVGAERPPRPLERRRNLVRGMKRLFAFSSVLLLSACAATERSDAVAPAAPGFLLGVWHGFIFPVAWVVSLFMPQVAIYAVPNNGGWYDFGYFLGIVVFGVGAHRTKTVYRDRVIDLRARRID